MKIEKGLISNSELIFLIGGFIQGSTLLTTFMIGATKQDTWLVVILGTIISIPIILIYIFLIKKFPNKNIIQMNKIIYGKYLGILVSLLYIWFFFSLATLNLKVVSAFLTTYILPETSEATIIFMFVLICAYGIKKGFEVIARCSFIFVILSSVIILLTFILLIKDMDFTSFLPILEAPPKSLLFGTHLMSIIPICEIITFMMIIPYVNDKKQVPKSIFKGVAIGALTILIVILRDIAILGVTANIMYLPSFEAVRLIDIAGISSRLEVLDSIVLLITFFLKICVLYYATVFSIAQTFELHSYDFLILIIGIILLIHTLIVFDSIMEHSFWGASTAATYSLFFEVLIPLLSLIIVVIRKLPKKMGGEFN